MWNVKLRSKMSKEEIILQQKEILDRVQQRGEEYCYLTRNCAKGSATALLEEFGLGNMEIIRALSPFLKLPRKEYLRLRRRV